MSEACGALIQNESFILLAVLALEWWLGRTEKTEAGSTIDFIYKLALALSKRRKTKE